MGYKSTVAAAAIAASLAMGSAAMAKDLPSTMTVPPGSGVEDITAQLRDAGFTGVRDAKLSGAIYEAVAMYGGEEVHLRLDTENGGLTKVADAHGDPMMIHAKDDTTDQEIRDSLARHGYSNFGDVKRSGDVIDVMASKNGEQVNLRIEQSTGVVTEQGGDSGRTMSSETMRPGGTTDSTTAKETPSQSGSGATTGAPQGKATGN